MFIKMLNILDKTQLACSLFHFYNLALLENGLEFKEAMLKVMQIQMSLIVLWLLSHIFIIDGLVKSYRL